MSETLVQLRTDVRSHLDEITARFWSDTELNRWINEACVDMARRTETLQNFNTNMKTYPGQAKYPMPKHIIRIHRLEFVPFNSTNVYTVTASTYQELDQYWGITQQSQMSYPYYYCLWGTPGINLTIQLYPVPSQAGTLNVFYYRLPITMVNDTDTAEIPSGWDDMVVLYCEYVAKRKDKDPTWQEAKGLYEERLSTMVDITRQWHDQERTIFFGNGAIPEWLYGGGGDW